MTPQYPAPPKILLQRYRSLQARKGRREHGAFLAEGPKVVGEALSQGMLLRTILLSESFAANARETALTFDWMEHGVYLLPDREFDRISPTDSPQGILAEFEIPTPPSLDSLVPLKGPVLILDEVQDPGNVGTAIRSCAALGGGAVLLTEGCADVWNPKTVRAAAGSTFRIPVIQDLEARMLIGWLTARRIEVWAASPTGEDLHAQSPPEGSIALLLGNESRGIGKVWGGLPNLREIGLPMERGVDSLNVGVTSAVFLGILREKELQKPVR